MRRTTPQVFLIARPELDWNSIEAYLKHVDGMEWRDRGGLVSHGETLVEFMGRLCYRSWKPGLNANVKKIREDSHDYLMNILKSAHGSVLEHAQYSFVFADVSRVFTHELVRHRAGVAISQESLRFVRLTDIGFRVPKLLEDTMGPQVLDIVERLEEFQVEAAAQFGLDEDGVPFTYKKEVTSALRRLAPIGLSTTIGWSANIRTLRWLIEMRTSPSAEEEIREVFMQVGQIMMQECPSLFGDFALGEAGEWIPLYGKV